MEGKDMKELPKEILDMVAGGTPEQAAEYWHELELKYGTTDKKELLQQMTREEFSKYELLYRF